MKLNARSLIGIAALSEKIVPYPHTAMFVKPEATDEIKRILRLNLKPGGETR